MGCGVRPVEGRIASSAFVPAEEEDPSESEMKKREEGRRWSWNRRRHPQTQRSSTSPVPRPQTDSMGQIKRRKARNGNFPSPRVLRFRPTKPLARNKLWRCV